MAAELQKLDISSAAIDAIFDVVQLSDVADLSRLLGEDSEVAGLNLALSLSTFPCCHPSRASAAAAGRADLQESHTADVNCRAALALLLLNDRCLWRDLVC